MALTTEEKNALITDFATHEGDTGSAQVQIAMLTTRINQMITHMRSNPHDHHSNRGLLKMVGRRRRLLKYIRETNPEQYQALIKRLGLRR